MDVSGECCPGGGGGGRELGGPPELGVEDCYEAPFRSSTYFGFYVSSTVRLIVVE